MGLLFDRALKRTLRRMSRADAGFKKQHRMFLRMAADDADMLKELRTRVQKMHGAPLGAKEFPLLKWLWDNRQAILEFVLQIIALFSKT